MEPAQCEFELVDSNASIEYWMEKPKKIIKILIDKAREVSLPLCKFQRSFLEAFLRSTNQVSSSYSATVATSFVFFHCFVLSEAHRSLRNFINLSGGVSGIKSALLKGEFS
ncbi:hypothetical protein H5410_024223 [Solanum commersonii]|uniref:Uncharacterized protein n=1 Tax=Solanum commersonii TaxID=4109 RepID=A0A9J5ZLG0_SOLCO|nr:hypothetical protein H5410_024223 [Solanum commersonii]